jgi:hypothetical protein
MQIADHSSRNADPRAICCLYRRRSPRPLLKDRRANTPMSGALAGSRFSDKWRRIQAQRFTLTKLFFLKHDATAKYRPA